MRSRTDLFLPIDVATEIPQSIRVFATEDESHPAGYVLNPGSPEDAVQRWREWVDTWLQRWPLRDYREVLDVLRLAEQAYPGVAVWLPGLVEEFAEDGAAQFGISAAVELVSATGALRDRISAGAVRTYALVSGDTVASWLTDHDEVLASTEHAALRVETGIGLLFDSQQVPGGTTRVLGWQSLRPGEVTVKAASGTVKLTGPEAFLFETAAPRRNDVQVVADHPDPWREILDGLERGAAALARLPSARLYLASGW